MAVAASMEIVGKLESVPTKINNAKKLYNLTIKFKIKGIAKTRKRNNKRIMLVMEEYQNARQLKKN